MIRKPNIAMKLHYSDYDGIIDTAYAVLEKMNGNPAFPTPFPTLASVRAVADQAADYRAAWATRGNRGSHSDLVNLREKTSKLSLMLKSLSQYVMLTSQAACENDYLAMSAMIVTSGFPLKRDGTSQGLLDKVQNLRRVSHVGLNYNQAMFSWEAPLGITSPGNVKFYRIYISTDAAAFSAAREYDTTTKTSFVFTNSEDTLVKVTFWVVAVNSAGEGALSNGIPVTLISI